MFDKILTETLEYYMTAPLEMIMLNIRIKERIGTIRDMQIIIHSDDHNPPHFHVKSKDNRVNAKFLLRDGSLIEGRIDSKDLKRIKAFYCDVKIQKIMEMIWNKRNK